jgi:cytochrome c553
MRSAIVSTAIAAGLVSALGLADVGSTLLAQGGEVAVKRGEYLAILGGCHDCHTPFKMGANGPEPDMSLALSGHPAGEALPPPPPPTGPWVWTATATNTAFAGPWGISYSPNLTSHANGLGRWSLKMFTDAMRTGRHGGVGRPILPPMPWQNLSRLTDEDMQALFAYLKSVEPQPNAAPASVPAGR